MTHFTLTLDPESGLYAVFENGAKVKNDIFAGVEDFEQELKALEFNDSYTVEVA